MKILKYKKMSKGKYKVTFDTKEIIIYEDVIIKNNLLLTKDISLELLEKVLKENRYYEIYNISLSYLEIKMRSSTELNEYLKKKGFKSDLINEVIKRLEDEGYLNESRYIEAYTNDKLNLTSMGPYKIKKNLLDLGLLEYKIDEYLSTIDEDIWKEKLEKIIKKRVSLMKNKSLFIIKNKLKIDLFNLGYQNDLIDSLLNNIEKNDNDSLEKEYKKAYEKYNKKHTGIYLENNIRTHLYKKGFNIDDINTLIENKK